MLEKDERKFETSVDIKEYYTLVSSSLVDVHICTNESQLHDFEKKHECKFTFVDMYIFKQEKERIKVYFYFHNRVCILPQREASIIKNESIFK